MIQCTMRVGNANWRARGKNLKAIWNEIAMARVTGSVGSSSMLLCGGSVQLIAEVHRLNADGSDVRPS